MRGQIVSAILFGVGTCVGLCQTPQPPDPGPVQAELLANADVRHVQIGKTVFARTTSDWAGPECVLRKGAVVEGTVEQSVPRVGKGESKLAFSFKQAQCNGQGMRPLDLVLTVIARAPENRADVPNTQNFMTMSIPAGLTTASSLGIDRFQLTQRTLGQLQLSGIDHRFPARKGIRPGDVLDLKGLALDIGKGPNGSSVVSSNVRDVFLAESTQILLMPRALAFRSSSAPLALTGPAQPNAGDPAVPVAGAALAAAPSPFNDIEVCAPPGCAVDLPVTAKDLEGHTASSLPLRALGYVPRSNKVRGGFEDDESLVWLGPGQLLFAFNPHRLIRRGPERNDRNVAKVIRAVVVDPASRDVLRAVDWEITDSRRYLWPLNGGRVLVHVGNELRVYGAGLEVERSIPLAGPLWFVRIAPNGTLMAVATLRERHSPELHGKMRNELGIEPEEDLDVAILNQEFTTLAKATTVTGLMPPTLLNSGQVKLQSERDQWYRLAMSTWENKRVPLARFHSLCMPEVTSSAPDLLFLHSCNSKDGQTEYRVLRADGKVLLRGVSDPLDVDQEAMGNDGSRTFAVKVVRAGHSILPNTAFKSSDLDSAEVRVYRADDGRRLLAVRVKDPEASHGGYALSPDGSQLAVLSRSQIEFFPVPAK